MDILEKAIEKYGEKQLDQAQEELAELIVAISKYKRNENKFTISNVIVLEGDHTQEDIPYFTGIQSVENPTIITSNSPVQFGKGGRL